MDGINKIRHLCENAMNERPGLVFQIGSTVKSAHLVCMPACVCETTTATIPKPVYYSNWLVSSQTTQRWMPTNFNAIFAADKPWSRLSLSLSLALSIFLCVYRFLSFMEIWCIDSNCMNFSTSTHPHRQSKWNWNRRANAFEDHSG